MQTDREDYVKKALLDTQERVRDYMIPIPSSHIPLFGQNAKRSGVLLPSKAMAQIDICMNYSRQVGDEKFQGMFREFAETEGRHARELQGVLHSREAL